MEHFRCGLSLVSFSFTLNSSFVLMLDLNVVFDDELHWLKMVSLNDNMLWFLSEKNFLRKYLSVIFDQFLSIWVLRVFQRHFPRKKLTWISLWYNVYLPLVWKLYGGYEWFPEVSRFPIMSVEPKHAKWYFCNILEHSVPNLRNSSKVQPEKWARDSICGI